MISVTCTCMTKPPDIMCHDETCTYRQVRELEAKLERLEFDATEVVSLSGQREALPSAFEGAISTLKATLDGGDTDG